MNRPWAQNGVTLALYAVIACAWTWPLITDPTGLSVSPQFDAYSLIWLLDEAPRLGWDMVSHGSAWPIGHGLVRVDSFLALAAAISLRGLVDPVLMASSMALLGPILSAWAAERFAAHSLSVAWPWSLIAGLCYGFSGLMATALLEGHYYAMVTPWLPLLAMATLLATGPRARPIHGVAMAVLWTLCLLTTAYCGLAASLLVLGLSVRAPRRLLRQPVLLAGGLMLVAGVGFTWLYLQGDGASGDTLSSAVTTSRILEAGSASVADLALVSPDAELIGHSISPVLGWTCLLLFLTAPLVLKNRPHTRTLVILAVVVLVISMGPVVEIAGHRLPWILAPLTRMDWASAFRFPVRLMPVAYLCMGSVAAAAASALAARAPLLAAPLLLATVVDCFLGVGLPARTARLPLDVPSAYRELPPQGGMLELLPYFTANDVDDALFMRNLACSYQRSHHKPLTHACLGTSVSDSPGRALNDYVIEVCLDDSDQQRVQLRKWLVAMGISHVSLRPLLFPSNDRDPLHGCLEELAGEPHATSSDGGEMVVIYELIEPMDWDASGDHALYHAVFMEFL